MTMHLELKTHLIRPEGSTFEGTFSTKNLLDGVDSPLFSFDKDAHYQLHAVITQGQLIISGVITCECKATCARCLTSFNPILTTDRFTFYFDTLPENGSLDIGEYLREELMVIIPDNPHCLEDCKGLCSHCGANRNTKKCKCDDAIGDDGVWGDLKKLQF